VTDVPAVAVKEQKGRSPVSVDPPALEPDPSSRFERERIHPETEVLWPRRVFPLRKVDEARFETVEHQDKSRRREKDRWEAVRVMSVAQ
jgi:hypothetical protein